MSAILHAKYNGAMAPSNGPIRLEQDTPRALGQLVARSVAAQQAAAEADLATIPAQLADLSRRFVALDRRLPAAVLRLAQLRARSDADEFAAAELERLHGVQGVRGVQATGSTLRVQTESIIVAWGERHFDLGAYCLVLDLDGDVRVEALDRRGPKPHWDHPHVQDGLPCLGNLREGVLKLIAEYELAIASQVLIDFLRTYDPDTAYTPIVGWPEV
jgi:hypothetical protein